MSSSRFQPSVTPSTALATRLRARPWNFASAFSSPLAARQQLAVFDGHDDARRQRLAHLALRPLDVDRGAVDLDGDALRNRDWLLTDTRHVRLRRDRDRAGAGQQRARMPLLPWSRPVPHHHTLQSTSPPTPALARPGRSSPRARWSGCSRPARRARSAWRRRRHRPGARAGSPAGSRRSRVSPPGPYFSSSRIIGRGDAARPGRLLVDQLVAGDVALVLQDLARSRSSASTPACPRGCAWTTPRSVPG